MINDMTLEIKNVGPIADAKIDVGKINIVGGVKESIVYISRYIINRYSFSLNNEGKYVMDAKYDYYSGEGKGTVFGDFNGDGKMDFMVPQGAETSDWKLYINQGKSFSTDGNIASNLS